MVNLALVGNSRVAVRHLECIKDNKNIEISCVCDVDPLKAKQLGDDLGVPYFTNSDDMYSFGKFDVVDITVPSGYHYEQALLAIENKKHLMIEKPLCLRIDHAEAIVRACEQNNLKLWVIFQNRMNLAMQFAKKCIDEQKLGKIHTFFSRLLWCREHEYYNSDNWHGTWELDGGVICQQGIHLIDGLCWLLGKPHSVFGECKTNLANIPVEDTCLGSITFDSSVSGQIAMTTAVRPHDIEANLVLLGSKGHLVIGGVAQNKVISCKGHIELSEEEIISKYSEEFSSPMGNGHEKIFDNMVHVLADNGEIIINPESTLNCIKLVHSIYHSNHNKRIEIVSQVQNFPKLGQI